MRRKDFLQYLGVDVETEPGGLWELQTQLAAYRTAMEEQRAREVLDVARATSDLLVIDHRSGEPVPRSWDWLRSRFGDVTYGRANPHPEGDYVFRLAELHVNTGPAVMITRVVDEEDKPLEGYACIRYWVNMPSHHKLPNYGAPASRYTDLGIVGKTNAEGHVGWGLGHGDYYTPPNQVGATMIYVADFEGPSDWIEGLGMLAATEHETIHQVFQRVSKVNGGPAPIDPDPEVGEVAEELAKFRALFEKVYRVS